MIRPLLLLLALAAGLHLVRLSQPASVVFDEVHFGGFVNAYTGSGAHFFDIHPPHAKLLVAGVAALGGYRGTQDFAEIHTPYTRVSPALVRLVPALAGTALVPLVFAFLLQLGASRWAAFLGALAVALDNGLLLQTRVLALDGILLAAIFGALVAYQRALRCESERARSGWALTAGGLAGLAAGTKLTGLVALLLIALLSAVEWWHRPSAGALRARATEAVALLLGAAAVYLGGFAIHFALLDAPGPGDAWMERSGSLLGDVLRVHPLMLSANATLSTSHPYASAWWTWPLLLRPISYWSQGGHHLHFLGNPVVWWGALAGLVATLAGRGRARAWLPIAGWALSFAPLVAVPRPLFVYHYLTPLVFSICVAALWLDRAGVTRPGSWREQPLAVHALTALIAIGFIAVSPFTFADANFPGYQRVLLEWIPGWV